MPSRISIGASFRTVGAARPPVSLPLRTARYRGVQFLDSLGVAQSPVAVRRPAAVSRAHACVVRACGNASFPCFLSHMIALRARFPLCGLFSLYSPSSYWCGCLTIWRGSIPARAAAQCHCRHPQAVAPLVGRKCPFFSRKWGTPEQLQSKRQSAPQAHETGTYFPTRTLF